MKLYIIAGEASGDLHGSNLVKQLLLRNNQLEINCWGGELMEQAGAKLVKHYRDLAFMGFAEVLINLRTILNNFDFCKKDILRFKPDALVLIDYPGFNLRIAKWAKANSIRVFYYISPQVWAWKQNRVITIRNSVEKMFVVLPFEKDFYQKFGYEVEFVGHPLLDVINNANDVEKINRFYQENNLPQKSIIALLPGSRRQEITAMLQLMLSVRNDFPDYQFVVAGAPGIDNSFYTHLIQDSSVKIVTGKTYELLQLAKAGLVTSGTATLEAALFGMPQVVCYKGNALSYFIARFLVKVKYISLVNLILDKQSVRELIQQELNTKNLTDELKKIVGNNEFREKIKADYQILREKLGNKGASEKVAAGMLKSLEASLGAKH